MIKAQPGLNALRPREYKPVAHAVGTTSGGMLLHRGVDAMKVPGGFMVQVFEYLSDPTPHPVVTGPGPGHTATFFLPVQSRQEVQDAFFVDGSEEPGK